MTKHAISIQSFEIKYETAPEIPPPYCYYYQVKGKVNNGKLLIELEWVYHHREDLSLEDITDEGFSGDDNFSWKGNIGILWAEELEKQLLATQVNKNVPEEYTYMEIMAQHKNGVVFMGSPANMEEWEYLMQEFIQGIYEAAGKEAPLQIQFKKNFPDQSFFTLIMTLFFETRTVQISVHTSQSNQSRNNQIAENWEQTKSILRDIYSLHYLPGQGITHEPKERGNFIDSGDGYWYEFTTGVKNPGKSYDTLAKLEKYFLSFSR